MVMDTAISNGTDSMVIEATTMGRGSHVSTVAEAGRDDFDAVRWERDIAPSHFRLRIESFYKLTKMLSEGGIQCFTSKVFEASGYQWEFSMYPNGVGLNKGHISVFLCIQNTSALPLGDKVNKFHYLKQECGISKFVPRCEFDDAANGYLVDDTCVFGVEVFVIHSKFVEQRLSPLVKVGETYTWKVSGFSNMNKVCYSDEFTAASFKWKVTLYPLGVGSKRPDGLNLGLYLTLVDPGATPNALLVYFMLFIRNQKYGKHQVGQFCCCYSSESLSWGWESFMPLADLRDLSNGFIVNDCIIVEAHIKNVSIIQ
ncbi:PREDICTED: uncharacterized protein LOC109149239 [Ipomoea nil]|uniref:uncharacterized protein LOC109149239 n=1 Tax=Ipomoea nil TaxID=35883 RepID=UPI0009012789|nr:PREDICTED: uncharacterized protein LOC109149239 [Ipomoea nil]